MDLELKARLKVQIQAYVEKKQTAELREVQKWLETDNSLLQGIQYNPKTLKSFVFYQLNKFKTGSDVTKHQGGSGRLTISKRKENQILRLSLIKENAGLRHVGLRETVAPATCWAATCLVWTLASFPCESTPCSMLFGCEAQMVGIADSESGPWFAPRDARPAATPRHVRTGRQRSSHPFLPCVQCLVCPIFYTIFCPIFCSLWVPCFPYHWVLKPSDN